MAQRSPTASVWILDSGTSVSNPHGWELLISVSDTAPHGSTPVCNSHRTIHRRRSRRGPCCTVGPVERIWSDILGVHTGNTVQLPRLNGTSVGKDGFLAPIKRIHHKSCPGRSQGMTFATGVPGTGLKSRIVSSFMRTHML